MNDVHVHLLALPAVLKLNNAARITRCDDAHARIAHVLHLSIQQAHRSLWLGYVVDAGAPAAPIGFH